MVCLIGEIWYYKAKLPNNDGYKSRPVLVIGTDANNNLYYTDIHYVIISSSSSIGVYDVIIDEGTAKSLNLVRASVIKTTKIYTGPKNLFERKVCDLPSDLKDEFINKYQSYQQDTIDKLKETLYITN